ncbi:Zn(2)-C6 fungal-type transcription factor [Pseudohyphozyma bogoriensis]|nr:Zn(2)-C6 fungal-type transcription factor [Pseudohyphozyma bogoriensis]
MPPDRRTSTSRSNFAAETPGDAGRASTSQLSPPAAGSGAGQVPQLLATIRAGLEQLIERGGIEARASRQGKVEPKIGACTACRAVKIKCSQDTPSCKRCTSHNIPCVFLQHVRRGNVLLLASLLRDAETAHSALTGETLAPKPLDVLRGTRSSTCTSPDSSTLPSAGAMPMEEDDDLSAEEGEAPTPGLEGVIENPLAVLAHIASGPQRKGETTEHESGKATDWQGYDAVVSADQYFSTGLYELRLDIAPQLDIVNLGIITMSELTQMVNFYFSNLHESAMHLHPVIHTPQLIRDTSPFLCTVVAYLVSGFLPHLNHLVEPLRAHAMMLSDRVFSLGLKSLEEWAPASDNWGADRTWTWLGQAHRIATEVRMDKETNEMTCTRYSSITPIPEQAVELFGADRRSASVSTGRFAALNFTAGFRREIPICDPEDKNYSFLALEALNRIFAKALMLFAGLQDEATPSEGNSDYRQAFTASWIQEMDEWEKRWTNVNGFVRILFFHAQTILHSTSLHFPGPVTPVLQLCRTTALGTLRVVADEFDASLASGANTLVTCIVYAATLLLRINPLLSPNDDISHENVLSLCSKTVNALEGMAALRFNIRTSASLHATRLRKLLADNQSPSENSRPFAFPANGDLTVPAEDSLFNFDEYANLDYDFSLSALALPDWTLGGDTDWTSSMALEPFMVLDRV